MTLTEKYKSALRQYLGDSERLELLLKRNGFYTVTGISGTVLLSVNQSQMNVKSTASSMTSILHFDKLIIKSLAQDRLFDPSTMLRGPQGQAPLTQNA